MLLIVFLWRNVLFEGIWRELNSKPTEPTYRIILREFNSRDDRRVYKIEEVSYYTYEDNGCFIPKPSWEPQWSSSYTVDYRTQEFSTFEDAQKGMLIHAKAKSDLLQRELNEAHERANSTTYYRKDGTLYE